jgi:hypothetical protein
MLIIDQGGHDLASQGFKYLGRLPGQYRKYMPYCTQDDILWMLSKFDEYGMRKRK